MADSHSHFSFENEEENYRLNFHPEDLYQHVSAIAERAGDINKLSNPELKILLNDLKTSKKDLQKAKEEIAVRKELGKLKKDDKRDIAIDIALAFFAKDFTLDSAKTEMKDVVKSALAESTGLPKEFFNAIDDIRDIKAQLTEWKNHPEKFAAFLIGYGSDLFDAVKAVKHAVQIKFNPLIPEPVLKATEAYLDKKQKQCDELNTEVTQQMLAHLKGIAEHGIAPTEKNEPEKIQQYLEHINDYVAELAKRDLTGVKLDPTIQKLIEERKKLEEKHAAKIQEDPLEKLKDVLGLTALKIDVNFSKLDATISDREEIDKRKSFVRSDHIEDADRKALVRSVTDMIGVIKAQEEAAGEIARAMPDIAQQQKHLQLAVQKKDFLYGGTLPEHIESAAESMKKLNPQEQWKSMALILSDANALHNGLPQNLAQVRKQSAEFEKRAAELKERHEQLEKILTDKTTWNSRSAYLADFSPYALKVISDRLEATDDMMRDSTYELLNPNEYKKLSSDIKQTREEIAISMYERLVMTNQGKPADLVAKHLNITPSAAYALSDADISYFMDHIEKYGSAALKQKAEKELGSGSNILERRLAPFDAALNNYFSARAQNNDAATYTAAVSMAQAATWLPQPENKSKQAYVTEIEKALRPSSIIQSQWAKDIEHQKMQLKKDKEKIVGTLKPKVESTKNEVDVRQESLTDYKNSNIISRFFKRNFGDGDTATRTQKLNEAKRENARAQETLDRAVNRHKTSNAQLKKHVVLMTEHVVNTIDEDVHHKRITKGNLDDVRKFIQAHNPALREKLEKKLNFSSVFLGGIVAKESLSELKDSAELIGLCQTPKEHQCAENILSLVNLKSPYENHEALLEDIRTLATRDVFDSESGFTDVARVNETYVSEIVSAIKENYLAPEILKKLTDTHYSRIDDQYMKHLESLLNFYSPQEKSAWIEKYIIPYTQNISPEYQKKYIDRYDQHEELFDVRDELFRALAILPAFSDAENYTTLRDTCFEKFFKGRMEYVFENPDRYIDPSGDIAILEAATNALLPDEITSIAQKILDEKFKTYVEKIPAPKWNPVLARLVEDHGNQENKDAYRLIRLNELVKNTTGVELSAAKSDIDAMKKMMFSEEFDAWKQSEKVQTLVERLENDPRGFASHEMIVRELGSEKQLQDMHYRWMEAVLQSPDQPNHDIGYSEKIIRDLLKDPNLSSMAARSILEKFIGTENTEKLADEFKKKVDAFLESADTNKQEDFVRIFGGAMVEHLLHAFVLPNKEALQGKVAEIKMARDLEMLTRAAKESIQHINTIAETPLQHMNEVLFAAEEPFHRIAADVDVNPDKDFEMVEIGLRNSKGEIVEGQKDRELENKQRERNTYRYQKNPEAFYTLFLLPIQQTVQEAIQKIFLHLDLSDGHDVENIQAQLPNIIEKIVKPAVTLDEKRVSPMMAILESQASFVPTAKIQNIVELKSALINLGHDNAQKDRDACLAWCDANAKTPGTTAIKSYITACENAATIRQLTKGLQRCLSLELATDQLIRNKSTAVDIAGLIEDGKTLLEKLAPEFQNRFTPKIAELMNIYKEQLSHNRVDETLSKTLGALINVFGNDEQKNRFEILQKTDELLQDIATTPIPKDVICDHAVLTEGLLSKLRDVDIDKGGYLILMKNIAAFISQEKGNPKVTELATQLNTEIIKKLIADKSITAADDLLFNPAVRELTDTKHITNAAIKLMDSSTMSTKERREMMKIFAPILLKRAAEITSEQGYVECRKSADELVTTKRLVPNVVAVETQEPRGFENPSEEMSKELSKIIELTSRVGSEKNRSDLGNTLRAFFDSKPDHTQEKVYRSTIERGIRESGKTHTIAATSRAANDGARDKTTLHTMEKSGFLPPDLSAPKPKPAPVREDTPRAHK